MKFSTRARYGLRLMMELTRELEKQDLVHLGRVAKITGLSMNYLAQLAIPLRNAGLLHGISGKNGGYRLARSADTITVREILEAVQGPIGLTDCANHPELCLNCSFCEARMIFVIATYRMVEVFEKTTLADLLDEGWKQDVYEEFSHIPLLQPDTYLAGNSDRFDV